MLDYDWPGNVRELENCVERAVALGADSVLDVADLTPAIRAGQPGVPQIALATQNSPSSDLEELERETIQRVFDQVGGDKTAAGKMLGISRATLYRKLKRYSITRTKAIAATA
jgi:DNA-binding NtrC family response regulator